MSNALAVYSKINDPIAAAKQMALACCRVCGGKTEEEGFVIALTCQIEAITPVEFNRKYHMIQGKPSTRADWMLAEFNLQGGDHEIVELSPDRCAMKFTWKNRTVEAEFTWEQAQQSRWPWKNPNDHSEGLKDNWSTPVDRENMLFVRLVTSRLRKIAPQLFSGVYAPEELQDEVAESKIIDVKPQAPAVDVRAEMAKRAAAQVEQPKQDDAVIDADYQVVDSKEEPPFDMPADAKGSITSGQASRLVGLFSALSLSDANIADAYSKRGASKMEELSRDQADEMIQKLEAVKAQRGKR